MPANSHLYPEEDIEIVDTLQKETEGVAFAHGTLTHSRLARKGEGRGERESDVDELNQGWGVTELL